MKRLSLSDDFLFRQIPHAVLLERYKKHVARELLKEIDAATASIIIEMLDKEIREMPRRQVEKLVLDVERSNRDGYEAVIQLFTERVREYADYEANYQVTAMREVFGGTFNKPINLYAAITARPFEGRLLSEWYEDLEQGQFKRLRGAIRSGWIEGKSTLEIVRDIRGTKTDPGITNLTRNGTVAAVRTALQHTSSVAKEEVYKKNSSRYQGVEWVSVLDTRTTDICMDLDGRVFPVGEGLRPPAHIGCRSTTNPILKGQKKTKQAIDYETLLRSKSATYQTAILGKRGYALFQSGKSLAEVVKLTTPISFDQMRRKDAEIRT